MRTTLAILLVVVLLVLLSLLAGHLLDQHRSKGRRPGVLPDDYQGPSL